MTALLRLPQNPRHTQLDLFGGSIVLGPARTFAIDAVGDHECENCGDTYTPRVLTTDTEYVHSGRDVRPSGHGWEWSYGSWERERSVWSTCDGDTLCRSCDEPARCGENTICDTCDECESCCDCLCCHDCEENTRPRDYCHTGDHCESCCNCVSCYRCGGHLECSDSCCYCHRCENCNSCCSCEDADDDSHDVDIISEYSVGLPRDGRTFGVELEIVGIGPSRAAAALSAAGLTCAGYLGYTHARTDVWKVVDDSSVTGGCEVVSPILSGADGLHQLETAMLALQANGADVDSQCGTHVHHGMPNATGLDLALVAKFYDLSHDAIDRLHPKSRRGSSEWSGPNHVAYVDRVEIAETVQSAKSAASGCQRYSSVNLTAFPKYETVEFRQHAGTLNFRKLSAWISFGQALISAATAGLYGGTNLSMVLGLLLEHGLSRSDADYLSERASALDMI